MWESILICIILFIAFFKFKKKMNDLLMLMSFLPTLDQRELGKCFVLESVLTMLVKQ